MKYTIGKYEFASAQEYEAAKRDVAKLRGMERKGRTTADISLHYLRQIQAQRITFETKLGRDFVKDAKQNVYEGNTAAAPAPERIEERYVVSRRKKLFRNMLLLPLYLTFALVVAIFGALGYREYRSNAQLEDIQESIHAEAAAYADSAAETTDADNAADTASIVEEILPDNAVPEPAPVVEEQPPEVLPQFAELAERNADFAGWLTIPGTPVDYPVMYRADDNDFYLAHNFDGEDDKNGLLVLDKRCAPDASGINSLIHGHNMKSGAMFGSLMNYIDEGYFRVHPTIRFSTLYEEREYDIFAVFRSSVYDENTTDFQYFNYIQIDNEDQFHSYVDNAKAQALYDTGVDAAYGDALITLSTCEYSKENGRLVLVGRQRK